VKRFAALAVPLLLLGACSPSNALRPGLCQVASVTDGDTIRLTGCPEDRVRLLLVDAPEVARGGSAGECYGEEARAYLRSRLPAGTQVRLESGVLDADQFGRSLRYVFLGDELINESLVREGYATRFRAAEDTRYLERISTAEAAAQEERRGSWAACR
jgi:micrococcal nuclease